MAVLRKLSFRVAILIWVLGPTFLIAALVLGGSYARFFPSSGQAGIAIAVLALVGFGVPLLLGLLVSHFVAEPLKEFAMTVRMVRESNYAVKVPRSDLQEFDTLIVEFNQLTERLSREEGLRRDLLSDTSHELNTPLAALAGQIKGMKDGILEVTPERLDILAEQTDRLSHLVRELQRYAEIRSSATGLRLEKVKLPEVINAITELFHTDLQEKGVTLESALHPPTLLADSHLLERLLSNLVSNSIRHSGGDTISITFNGTQLVVRDNGNGVPKESLGHITERFYRLDPSRSRVTGGLGLGLAIVKEIVEAHEWKLETVNAHPGLEVIITI